MFTPGYFVTAELKVKDPSRAAIARTELMSLCEKSIHEQGCTLFKLHEFKGQPERFMLWERFDDEAAFKSHFEEIYTKAYIAKDLTDVVKIYQTNLA